MSGVRTASRPGVPGAGAHVEPDARRRDRRTRARVPRTPGYVTVVLILLVAEFAVAAVPFWPVYRDQAFLVAGAGAVLAGSVVAAIAALRRWSSFPTGLACALAFVLLGVPLAVPGRAALGVLPTLDGLADLVSSLALGWKQLLTISLPVGSYEALLVPPFALLLTASAVAVSIALRSRIGELAVLVPVVVFLTAILFGSQDAFEPVRTTLALLALVLLHLVWARWVRRRAALRVVGGPSGPGDEPRTGGVRSLLAATLLVAIAATASVAWAAWLPPAQARQVLRASVQQPFDPRRYTSPLSGFRGYLQEPADDAVLFTVAGLPAGGRIRVATMDDYDGVVYAVGTGSGSGTFTRVPSRRDAGAGDPVSLRVRIGGYSGVWVPDAGSLEAVDFGGARAAALDNAFVYDDSTGTAAVATPLASGDSYRLDAVLPPEPSAAQLRRITPGSAQVPAPQAMPDALVSRLAQYTSGTDGDGAKLAAALAGLARDGYISHGIAADDAPSRSGHSSDRIAELFGDQLMVGDAEQYSVAAALMARELGFPARVVFGFVPADAGSPPGAAVAVHGSDVSAWIEVDTAQYGWVTVDPTPAVRPIPEQQPEDPTRINRPQTQVPPPVVQSEPQDDTQPPESSSQTPPSLDPLIAVLLQVLRITGWALLGFGLVLAPFLAVVAAKVQRRRRRRSAADARDRIRGGWSEFEDSAVDRGYRPPDAATRSQVAEVVGGDRSRVLAAVTDRAVFAPEEPSAEDADRVWRAVDELQRAMDRRLSRWQRLRAAVSLNSLRRYSGGRRRGRGA